MTAKTTIIVSLFMCIRTVSSQRTCDETKCTDFANDCLKVTPYEACTCQDGYEAVIETDTPWDFPWMTDIITYTCCESNNKTLNQASYMCTDSLVPTTKTIPDEFEGCTWDKCMNVYWGFEDQPVCVSYPGEPCLCSDGYQAKKTGKATPYYELFETGYVMDAQQFICCPPDTPGLDGESCAVPACPECMFSEVCFQELGCFMPENTEEFEGCVSDKCTSGYLDLIKCWVGRLHSCTCDDGLVAKTTGRKWEDDWYGSSTLEYVCCPPDTPGAEGEQCNGRFVGFQVFYIFSLLGLTALIITGVFLKFRDKEKKKIQNSNKEEDAPERNHCSLQASVNDDADSNTNSNPISVMDGISSHLPQEAAEQQMSYSEKVELLYDFMKSNEDFKIFLKNKKESREFNNRMVPKFTHAPASGSVGMIACVQGGKESDTKKEESKKNIAVANGNMDAEDTADKKNHKSDCEALTRNNDDVNQITDIEVPPLGDNKAARNVERDSPSQTRAIEEENGAANRDSQVSGVIIRETRRRQRGVSAGLDNIVSQKNPTSGGNFDGIHQYVMHRMTENNSWDKDARFLKNIHQCVWGFLVPFVSWAFLILPFIGLNLIQIICLYPKCKHAECNREGEQCLYIDDFNSEVCAAPGIPCPYLKDVTVPTPFESLFLCVLVSPFLIRGIIYDLEENIQAIQAAKHRLKNNHGNNCFMNAWVTFHIWGINLYRGYLIPVMIFAGTIAILHSTRDGLRASQILLNGIAILMVGGKLFTFFWFCSQVCSFVCPEI